MKESSTRNNVRNIRIANDFMLGMNITSADSLIETIEE